ncbi:MAG: universal stress protein [Chloroflexia bacterium]
MFRRVLFPTDFSAYAAAVVDCLPELRQAGTEEVVLLGVIRPAEVPLGGSLDQDILEEVRWGAEQQLHIVRRALEGQGLAVRIRLEVGPPVSEILRVAAEEQVHLIVMGAQGRSLVQELLLGSVAHEVARRAPVPVLIEKFEVIRQWGRVECRRRCTRTFQRVLHPTDFSDCANEAFHLVKRLAAAGTQEVILVHVQDERTMRHRPPEQLAEFDRVDSERLDRMRRALLLHGIPQVKVLLRHGHPVMEVLRVAEEESVCLIVLGSRGSSPVAEILAGSTFENVIRQSRWPVLVVRGGKCSAAR